jgi:DNA-binding PadR family transcriptional regulator
MRNVDTKLETELKRGIFQIAVLSLLSEPRYGYQIGRVLSDHGLAVEEGTLYPLLRRMEEQGLLESWWVTEQARPRKYYRTTDDGRDCLRALVEIWGRVDASLRRILAAAVVPEPPPQGSQDPTEGDADG